jgi:uncharacterized protein (TIGR02147 family)
MTIFEFDHYKSYLKQRIKELPGHGRGELSRIAKALNIHTTMVTHVLKGAANFSIEQALSLADYLGLNELETDFLLALVQWERAGTTKAKDFYHRKIVEIRLKALNLTQRLGTQNKLSNSDRAFFYSSWVYTAIRLLTAIDRFQTPEALAHELDLPIGRVRAALEFLISRGLCTEENSKVRYAAMPTYLEASSPLVSRHHQNWRHKAQERFERIRESDLVFTFPMVISDKDALRIREKLVQLIGEVKTLSEPSPSEELFVLNIDWIKLTTSAL